MGIEIESNCFSLKIQLKTPKLPTRLKDTKIVSTPKAGLHENSCGVSVGVSVGVVHEHVRLFHPYFEESALERAIAAWA